MTTPQTRLLALWARASRREREEGREWYERAYIACADAGGGLSDGAWPASRSCAVAGAYSPRVPWSRALHLTERTWTTGVPAGHTRSTLATVERLLSARLADLPAVLRGPKVSAFYSALLGDVDSAVCDVHMYRAMGLSPRAVPHDVGAQHIRDAARRVCEPVAQFQATVWIVQRGGGE